MLGQTGRISNDSVSTTYVVPCGTGTWAAYHPWWRDVYLKLTCNLPSAHAVSETATPLGQREIKSVDVKKFCYEKTEKNLLGAPGGNMSVVYAGGRLPVHCALWSLGLSRFLPLGIFICLTWFSYQSLLCSHHHLSACLMWCLTSKKFIVLSEIFV